MAITYNDLFLDIRRELKQGGVTDTTLEARELTCFGVNKSREELARDGRLYAPPELEKRVRELTAPGMWMQNFTTNEPDDSMIECAIRSLELVLPSEKGKDEW